MERLVTTNEAAKLLGLSLQGVHYRIKNGQLKSLKQGGKTFVYVTEFFQEPKVDFTAEFIKEQPLFCEKTKKIIDGKDEQILLLKENIIFIKAQYKDEIERLEKNQKRIIKVFNSEIELLKSAFNEMRTIYKNRDFEIKEISSSKFIPIEEFLNFMKECNKSDKEIKIIILNSIKRKDSRFFYNKKSKKLLIKRADYSDLI